MSTRIFVMFNDDFVISTGRLVIAAVGFVMFTTLFALYVPAARSLAVV